MNAIIFLAHQTDARTLAALHKLRCEMPPNMQLLPVFDTTRELCDRTLLPRDAICITFNEVVADSPYPGKTTQCRESFYPGCHDLILLWLFRRWPGFEYYWFVEYDMDYTGDWRDFFAAFLSSDSDMLATTVFRYAFRPSWPHWKQLQVEESIRRDDYIRALCCIARYSAAAFACLDAAYRSECRGHFECLIPTLLHHHGLKVEDFGGDGEFVKSGNTNRFYLNNPGKAGLLPGSLTFAPNDFDPSRHGPLLRHPVK
jgi:hypothetical protein